MLSVLNTELQWKLWMKCTITMTLALQGYTNYRLSELNCLFQIFAQCCPVWSALSKITTEIRSVFTAHTTVYMIWMWCSGDLMRVNSNWHTQCTRKTEIGQFDDSMVVNQQILWLQVTVNYTSLMAEQNCLQNLVQIALHSTTAPSKSEVSVPHYVLNRNFLELKFNSIQKNDKNRILCCTFINE